MIEEIKPMDVVAGIRETLGLPSTTCESIIDDTLLAALIRRAAGILCPCSRATLRSALLESLHGLNDDQTSLSDKLDALVEHLIVAGDLLELNDVTTTDEAVKSTWVFASPPSFVVRPSGGLFLLGVVPDHDTFLPPSLASRVIYEGITRTIYAEAGENLSLDLREHGVQELSESVWLKAPKPEPAENLIKSMERRLHTLSPSGQIAELQIIDPEQPVKYYRGRWSPPTQKHTGNFIARRPRAYGAPLWCFVALDKGLTIKVLDLPLRKVRWRGSDLAWHLQMAIDHVRGSPQIYNRTNVKSGARFDFFSPIPQWAERRLMVFGKPTNHKGTLFSYWLPKSEADTEEVFLRQRLWLELAKTP